MTRERRGVLGAKTQLIEKVELTGHGTGLRGCEGQTKVKDDPWFSAQVPWRILRLFRETGRVGEAQTKLKAEEIKLVWSFPFPPRAPTLERESLPIPWPYVLGLLKMVTMENRLPSQEGPLARPRSPPGRREAGPQDPICAESHTKCAPHPRPPTHQCPGKAEPGHPVLNWGCASGGRVHSLGFPR